MTAPTAGTTPRPWKWIEPHSIMHQPDGLKEVYIPVAAIDGLFSKRHANAALIVYAVNHIEAAEAALTEALALLRGVLAWKAGTIMRREAEAEARAFLAAHAAPEEKEKP